MAYSKEKFEAAQEDAAKISEGERKFIRELPRSENSFADFPLAMIRSGAMTVCKMLNDLSGKSRKLSLPDHLKNMAEQEARGLNDEYDRLCEEVIRKGEEYSAALKKVEQFAEEKLGAAKPD